LTLGRAQPIRNRPESTGLNFDQPAAKHFSEKSTLPVTRGAPEILGDSQHPRTFDLSAPQYAESYLEIAFYNDIGFKEAETLRRTGSLVLNNDETMQHLEPLQLRPAQDHMTLPEPPKVWLHARMDLQSDWDCYRRIAPLKRQRVGSSAAPARRCRLCCSRAAAKAVALKILHQQLAQDLPGAGILRRHRFDPIFLLGLDRAAQYDRLLVGGDAHVVRQRR
jgi:hypothetical protein